MVYGPMCTVGCGKIERGYAAGERIITVPRRVRNGAKMFVRKSGDVG